MSYKMLQLIIKVTGLLALTKLSSCIDINAFDYHAPRHAVGQQRAFVMNDLEMATTNKKVPTYELKAKYWQDLAHRELRERVEQPLNLNKAKNVIMFLGDGMSLSTVTAARILKGQRQGFTGEEEKLSFEEFPYMGLSRTYCTNAQVPDSACTATAYLCGVKTNTLTIGITPNIEYDDCKGSMDPANHVSSIAAWAQEAGKGTGFITTTTLTHASPAGLYAHVANRNWESDTDVITNSNSSTSPKECIDIAQQLVLQAPGSNFDVIMGGGMGKFVPATMSDSFGTAGERQDGKRLLSQWQNKHPSGTIVVNRDELLNVNITRVSNIMGIFSSQLMEFHLKADKYVQPTLAEMTEVALNFLNRKYKNKGYFIFIEGGLIDYGNHNNQAAISLDEALEFEKAVKLARDMTDPKDTLIVVTADHAHPLSISGYPERGNSILNLNNLGADDNGVPYSTLNYAVGPEQYLDESGKRLDLTGKMGAADFVYPSEINSEAGVHGGDDVGVYASGPYEHLFRGVLQENTIPHLMAYAACIGNGPKSCG